MSPLFIDADTPAALVWMSNALWMLARASALLAIAAVVVTLIRRRASAATRHLVWTLAVVSLLVLPVLSAVMPGWMEAAPAARGARATRATEGTQAPQPLMPVARGATAPSSSLSTSPLAAAQARAGTNRIPPAASEAAARVATPDPAAAPGAPAGRASRVAQWPTLLLAAYVIGVLLLFARQFAQWLALRRIARRADLVSDPEWTALFTVSARDLGVAPERVRLLRSREQAMPMAFGTRHPAIVIPAMADIWPEDRRRAVLLHELAHVARRDCLTQWVAATACSLYWIHPAVWWVARRLRIERELACDDRVLTAGTHAREYAGHLLEIAYSLGGDRAPALAVSMARRKHLEGRMLAVLDAARNRATPGFRSRAAGIAIAGALVIVLAGAEARVASSTATAAGTTNETESGEPSAATVGTAASAATAPAAPSPATLPKLPKTLKSWDSIEPVKTLRSLLYSAAQMAAAQDRLTPEHPGTWEIHPAERYPDHVYVRLTDGERSSTGFTIPLSELQAQIGAGRTLPQNGDVTLAITRDAGTFNFEGRMRSGVGAGTFTFTADTAFPGEMAKRGFARPTRADQLALARADIGFAYLDELNAQSYAKPDLPLLVKAGEHGAGLDYLRGMGKAGHRLGSLEPLIKLRDHGVTPEYITELASLGYKGLSTEQLQRARDHGMSAEYVREMRNLGYGTLTLEALINARDHGVSSEYVSELAKLGFTKLALEDVIRARDHGVSSEFAREMRDMGYTLSLDDLQKARDHGVSGEYVREMSELGYRGLSIEMLTRARDHGVSSDYARGIKGLGYSTPKLEELIVLRDHGVSTDKIRRANERAGKQLPLDMIRDMVSGGGLR